MAWCVTHQEEACNNNCSPDCNHPDHFKAAEGKDSRGADACKECLDSDAQSQANDRYWSRLESYACGETD